MNINKLKSIIDKISEEHEAAKESNINVAKDYFTEEIKKLAYEFVIEYALVNGLVLEGFDFKRYKSDKDYIWYDELLKVLETLNLSDEKRKIENNSLEVLTLFGYLDQKFN